ncbi:MAG: HipA domain-containing protein [Clostridiales Family XIII bacterium]|jgi:hypothetical protein|nr:HipA domain-containing protein [Clostridiales Family XIII bacterium]
MEVIDFNQYSGNMRFYGGEAGQKLGIVYEGANWILKYPKSTRSLVNPKISYTTSPLSEYIGSKVYESIGIPVHKTAIGYRDGKIVVACRDFLAKGERLVEFRDIKNTYNAALFESGSSGSGTILSEVLTVIDENSALQKIQGVRERFWDMFVIDAYIGNHDRNNTNWGIITCDDELVGLAPVYDNGGALYDKRDDATFSIRANDERALYIDAVNSSISAYIGDDGHHINPISYIVEKSNPHCNEAVARFAGRCDQKAIDDIIASIPMEADGYRIIGKAQSEFYRKLLNIRHDLLCSVSSELG